MYIHLYSNIKKNFISALSVLYVVYLVFIYVIQFGLYAVLNSPNVLLLDNDIMCVRLKNTIFKNENMWESCLLWPCLD